MKFVVFKLIFITCLFLPNFNGVWSLQRLIPQYDDDDYNNQKLAIDWSPINTCENFFNNHTETTCSSCKSPKAINKWTIHGLWPGRSDGTSPFYCRNIPFDPNLLNDKLKAQLRIKWPSLLENRPDEDFWSHEWTKHGTCAYRTESTNSMEKYFSKTLELYDKFDVRKILDNAGIVPNNKYQTKDIQSAFRNALGTQVFVSCVINQQYQQQFLYEIHICFNKSITALVDCEDESIYMNSCLQDYEVTYINSC